MAIFVYKAINEQGKIIKGKISARNEAELEAKLKQSSLDLISSEELQSAGFNFLNRVSLKDLILICVHLNQLENAGVPILDSIAELRDTVESPAIKNVMMDIHNSLTDGKLLSAAMSNYPKVFDKTFVALVAAGERTGSFGEVFGHLEHHLKWVLDIKLKIKKATMYPMFLFFLMLSVVMTMMIYVIPKLTVFLVSQNIELPFYTRALIASSDFIVEYWYLVAFFPIIFFGLYKFVRLYSPNGSKYIDWLLLRMPVFGNLMRKLELARFCHFFAITYRSGMGVLECLSISGNVVQNLTIRETIEEVRNSVAEGQKITDALMATEQFPPLVVRMFKVGENSGNLDKSLEIVNLFYEQEVNEAVNSLVEMLQPILTLIMGGLLMWIALSVFGPVYASFGAK
jgi:type IV pilus assembly protein PilC